MEKTPKYEFGKPDQNDFYDVDVFNNNMEKVETAMTEFDDTGTVAEIKSFPEMLTKLVTGNKLAVTLRNLKAGLQFVLHAGSIVNNCVTDNPNLPLSAAQGKALMDLYNVLNTNAKKCIYNTYVLDWNWYGDGEYIIKNATFPMGVYIAIGANSRIQKRCTILQASDIITIPCSGGCSVEIQFVSETKIKIAGTNDNYKVREIIKREWIDRPSQ